MRYKLTSLFLYILICFWNLSSVAQVIPPDRLTEWNNPGSSPAFTVSQSVNLTSFGADTTGVLPSDAALQQAISTLGNHGEIFIPKGQYLFNQTIYLTDSIVLRGEIDTATKTPLSKLILSPGNNHAIIISGNEVNSGVTINYPLLQGDQYLKVSQVQIFTAGAFIRLKALDDSLLVNDFWAYHSTGQILEIIQISGDTLFLNKPLRRSYANNLPEIIILNPARQVHLKCLIIERADATTMQSSNIYFNIAADCSVSGVESYKCNYSHVDIFKSTRITIENSYFKDSHSYGSGGKAYGVMMEYATGDCFIHQNNFEHLRHSIIFQSGANGNVVAYNYSQDPYWTGTFLPNNSAGDLVFHGNYPYMNLLEGNVVQNIVIDNSHGINGPNNFFFRNRAELYGIFMNNSPVSDQQTFVGNQVINTSSSLLGLYALQGSNHFEYGNQIKGTIIPAGTAEPSDTSMFSYSYGSFYQTITTAPPIRNNNWQITTPHITAEYQNDNLNINSICEEIIYTGTSIYTFIMNDDEIVVFPNPSSEYINIKKNQENKKLNYVIYNTLGTAVLNGVIEGKLLKRDISGFLPGIYLLKINDRVFKIIKI